METIFGYKNLAKAIKPIEKFCKSIDKRIKVGFKSEFLSEMGTKTVFVGLYNFLGIEQFDRVSKIHKSLYETSKGIEFDEIDYNTFALLHEIGHVMSVYKYRNLERALAKADMDLANFRIKNPYATDAQEIEFYMHTRLEMDADRWAANYYKNNKQKVLKFQKKYLQAIHKMIDKVS